MKNKKLLEKYEFDATEMEILERCFIPYSFRKGENILSIGSVAGRIYFIDRGSMRTHYIDDKGINVSRRIYFENEFCTNWISFRNKTKSTENIETLEHTEGSYITYESFNILMNKCPSFYKLYIDILEYFQEYHQTKFYFINTMSAEEQLENIDKYFPTLRRRISNKVLASFLHITPQHLCRINKKIIEKIRNKPIR